MWPIGQTGCHGDSITMETNNLVTEIIQYFTGYKWGNSKGSWLWWIGASSDKGSLLGLVL